MGVKAFINHFRKEGVHQLFFTMYGLYTIREFFQKTFFP